MFSDSFHCPKICYSNLFYNKIFLIRKKIINCTPMRTVSVVKRPRLRNTSIPTYSASSSQRSYRVVGLLLHVHHPRAVYLVWCSLTTPSKIGKSWHHRLIRLEHADCAIFCALHMTLTQSAHAHEYIPQATNVFNPQSACAVRVAVLGLSVCLSVRQSP